MTPERYQQINQLADAALKLKADERKAFLAQACAGDDELRRAVESLITHEDRAAREHYLSRPAAAGFVPPPTATMEGKPTLLNGRYEIPDPSQPLGEGGFGKVYLAYDHNLHNRRVVVKTLKPAADAKINEYLHRKFHGDIDALTRFRHPHIVNILDQGALPDSGEPFFVMDLIEGQSLRDAMQDERLDFARVARIMQQAGHALSYAHERGVYHRDLKPDNLMLRSDDDSVIVIDFGIATVQEWKQTTRGANERKTMLVGTAEYMAPEQIRGEPTAASDIWALDVISFELLTGHLPFPVPRDAQTGQVQWRKLSDLHQAGVPIKPLELSPHLPAAVQPVLLKSLAFAPEDRHARASEFGAELAAALAGAQRHPFASVPTEIIARPTEATTEWLGTAATSSSHPAQSWESLRAHAHFTQRIWPEPAGAAKARGMGARPGSPQHRYRHGDRLRVVIDSDWEGHLLLLDEGPEGLIYCLCPSLFAPDTRLRCERCALPQAGARHDAFELSGGQLGREHLLAIVSDEPLGLDWLPRDLQEPARVLNQDDIGTLLNRLRALEPDRWLALSSYFEVVS